MNACVKCRHAMTEMSHGGVDVDLCQKCGGMWFDRGELNSMLGSPEAERHHYGSAIKTKHRCPKCRSQLINKVLSDAQVEVEKCQSCGGLFLDRGEVQKARKHLRTLRPEVTPKGPPVDAPAAKPPNDAVEIYGYSDGAMIFQYLTGLPIEIGAPQRLLSPAVSVQIILNLAVLAYCAVVGWRPSIQALGLIPAHIFAGQGLHTLMTSMYTHAGVFHLLGNMYFLFVLGDNVEEALGFVKFTVLYLGLGLVAGLVQAQVDPGSTIPIVGASGAVSGLIGAYVVMFPGQRMYVRFFYFLWLNLEFEWPAIAYFGYWIAMNVLFAFLDVAGMAWFAHIGGFVAGLVFGLLWRRYWA